MTASLELYPLSSQNGQAIPLDIIRPKGMLFYVLTGGAKKDITIPVGFTMAWVYSTADCIFSFSDVDLPNTLVDGTTYDEATFIPSNTLMVVTLTEGAGSILPVNSGLVYINKIEQWAALAQPRQLSFGE